jgi:hypothetical protein
MDSRPKMSAAKRVRNDASVDVDNVSVQLSPEMLRGLARIEAAVHDSNDFDPDIKKICRITPVAYLFRRSGWLFPESPILLGRR